MKAVKFQKTLAFWVLLSVFWCSSVGLAQDRNWSDPISPKVCLPKVFESGELTINEHFTVAYPEECRSFCVGEFSSALPNGGDDVATIPGTYEEGVSTLELAEQAIDDGLRAYLFELSCRGDVKDCSGKGCPPVETKRIMLDASPPGVFFESDRNTIVITDGAALKEIEVFGDCEINLPSDRPGVWRVENNVVYFTQNLRGLESLTDDLGENTSRYEFTLEGALRCAGMVRARDWAGNVTWGTYPERLVLWNQLGSDEEVLSSKFGPNLEFYDKAKHGGSGVLGRRTYQDGPFASAGKALVTVGECKPGQETHSVLLSQLFKYLTSDQGALELWFKVIKSSEESGYYRFFDGPGGLAGASIKGSETPELAIADGIGLYLNRSDLGFYLGWLDSREGVAYDVSDTSVSTSWHHLAAAWDRFGVERAEEGSDQILMFLDGEIVASGGVGFFSNPLGTFADIGGTNACGKGFAIDELKVWNYAKTDFSESLPPRITHQRFKKLQVKATGTDLKRVALKGTCPLVRGPAELTKSPVKYPVRMLELEAGVRELPELEFDLKSVRSCWWLIEVEDLAGNIETLDPVVTQVRIRKQHPRLRSELRHRAVRRVVAQSFRKIPGFEQYVTIKNGPEGIRTLRLFVNGKRFTARELEPNEVRHLSIADAMRPGLRNRIILRAVVKPGSRAEITIADQFFD